jgi:ABC-type glycerol-3-phosphate transport system substrate-binding protein
MNRQHAMNRKHAMNRQHVSRLAALTAAALIATALAACSSSSGGDPATGAKSTGVAITLYNGQHEQTADGLVAAFEKQTGITVNVQNDDEDTFANEIALQGSHSPADVIYTENSPRPMPAPSPRSHPSTAPRRVTGWASPPGSA